MPLTRKTPSLTAGRAFAPATLLLLLLLCPWVVAPVWAQVATAPTIKLNAPKPKLDSFRGEVLNFTPVAITVRDRQNMARVRTFNFDPGLARKVENRRMENGDRVTVRFVRGTDTAVQLKGKLRKIEELRIR